TGPEARDLRDRIALHPEEHPKRALHGDPVSAGGDEPAGHRVEILPSSDDLVHLDHDVVPGAPEVLPETLKSVVAAIHRLETRIDSGGGELDAGVERRDRVLQVASAPGVEAGADYVSQIGRHLLQYRCRPQ